MQNVSSDRMKSSHVRGHSEYLKQCPLHQLRADVSCSEMVSSALSARPDPSFRIQSSATKHRRNSLKKRIKAGWAQGIESNNLPSR